jgi:hypothetical protein
MVESSASGVADKGAHVPDPECSKRPLVGLRLGNQPDERVISTPKTEPGHGGLPRVVALGHSPLIVLFDDDGSDQAFYDLVVGEHPHDVGPALDHPV